MIYFCAEIYISDGSNQGQINICTARKPPLLYTTDNVYVNINRKFHFLFDFLQKKILKKIEIFMNDVQGITYSPVPY